MEDFVKLYQKLERYVFLHMVLMLDIYCKGINWIIVQRFGYIYQCKCPVKKEYISMKRERNIDRREDRKIEKDRETEIRKDR